MELQIGEKYQCRRKEYIACITDYVSKNDKIYKFKGYVLDANTGKPDTMGAAANTAAAPAVFTWNVNAKPFDELVRLWEFIGWDTKNVMAYVEQRGKNLNMVPGDILYQTIIQENIAYAEQEAVKGNPNFMGKKFSDNVPF